MAGSPVPDIVWVVAAAAALAVWWGTPPAALRRLSVYPAVGPRDGPGRRGRSPRRTGPRWPARLWGWVRARRPDRAAAARAEALRASVPQVCDLLAACLDAGRPPRSALRVVAGELDGPAAGELTGVLRRIDLGVDEALAWAELGSVPGYREVARDLSRAVQRGLGLATLLRQHAVHARQEAAAAALVRARAAGVRSVVPLMVCFLPAFLLLGVVPIFGAFVSGLMP